MSFNFVNNSGFSASSIACLPKFANHNFKGSAFGEGTDIMIRNTPSVFAQSVGRILPSGATNLNFLQIERS